MSSYILRGRPQQATASPLSQTQPSSSCSSSIASHVPFSGGGTTAKFTFSLGFDVDKDVPSFLNHVAPAPSPTANCHCLDRLVFDKGSVSPVSLDGVEEFSHV